MQESGIADDPDMDFVTGTHFESSDTDVVVDTSVEVTMMLETTDQEVAMYIDQGAKSTTFTVSGMAPSTVYYLYKDSYLDSPPQNASLTICGTPVIAAGVIDQGTRGKMSK